MYSKNIDPKKTAKNATKEIRSTTKLKCFQKLFTPRYKQTKFEKYPHW